MIVRLPEKTIEICREFANKRTDDSLKLYTMRGELKKQKIFADIFYGALAEYAVHVALEGSTAPDLRILPKAQKSFQQDITFNGLTIHVKSQGEASAKKYGLSWVFQKQDPLITKPTGTDVLALCMVLDDLSVDIRGFIPANSNVLHGNFKQLKVFQYRSTKLALYWDDFIDKLMNSEALNEFSQRNNQESEQSIEITARAGES